MGKLARGPSRPDTFDIARDDGPEVPASREAPSSRRAYSGEHSSEEERDPARDALTARGKLGDPTVDTEALSHMGSLVASRHLMALLANGRARAARSEVLTQVGNLVLALEDPIFLRRVLLDLADAGPIVDIYPLEVMIYVLERRPGCLGDIDFGSVVLNKRDLEAKVFLVEEAIVVKVPLALRMRAFALEGGGSPGYCFAPGAPAEYVLEFGAGGRYVVCVRGDLRGRSLIDSVVIQVEDPPDPP